MQNLTLIVLIGFFVVILTLVSLVYRRIINHIDQNQEDANKRNELAFANLASEKLEESRKKLEEREEILSQKNLKNLTLTLDPFKEDLKELKENINKNNIEQAKNSEIFKSQVESMLKVTDDMQKDANNLAKALKGDSKTQGDWGEEVLARTLEQSGLIEGVNYILQDAQEDNDGSRKVPDAIIYLPGERNIIIDSKVSLRAFVEYMNTEDSEEREKYLKKLINDVKERIKELKNKDYTSLPGINSPDYILIFFPIEAAYSLVASKDWDFQILSNENRIAFSTPTILMAILRMAENLWRIDHQNKNADLIADRAGLLVDKFSGLVEDFNQLGRNIKSLESSYDGARKKLDTGKGNIFNQIEDLEKLGAKNKKAIKKNKNLNLENLKNK